MLCHNDEKLIGNSHHSVQKDSIDYPFCISSSVENKTVISPKLSVIMLTYNHEKYIAQAIEGVLMQQTDFKFELIVANDHSTDATESVIKKYREKYPDIIKGFNNEKNLGPKINYIKAFKETKGIYIASCEGDDYWTDIRKNYRNKLNFSTIFLNMVSVVMGLIKLTLTTQLLKVQLKISNSNTNTTLKLPSTFFLVVGLQKH